MGEILVSMSEINRVAPWALRALGYPFGSAERATRHLVWTEAATGGGLAILSAGAEAIRAANAGQPVARSRNADGTYALAAGGRSLIDLGPAAVDLATAGARLDRAGAVALTGVAGTRLAASLCDLGARRGLATFAVFAAGRDEYAPDLAHECGWIVGLPGEDGPRFAAGALWEAGRLTALLDEPAASLLACRLEALRATAADGLGRLGLVTSACVPVANDLPGAPQDWSVRVDRAYRLGLWVEQRELDHLYDLEKMTWAPTSERSRKQAGF